jgi:hypothetical protein
MHFYTAEIKYLLFIFMQWNARSNGQNIGLTPRCLQGFRSPRYLDVPSAPEVFGINRWNRLTFSVGLGFGDVGVCHSSECCCYRPGEAVNGAVGLVRAEA